MEGNQLKEVLAKFGHEDFREGQREPIEAVLRGEDAVVVMPTGAGKSLCYQVTALMLPGTTLVVSPLIALMKDQVDALERKGVAVTLINSTVGRGETEKRLKGMADGEYKLVYVAPERFRNSAFRSALAKTRLSMVAIDEAHCISQWGHDFRPDYLDLGSFIGGLGEVRVMALTATATPAVREDIVRQLHLGEAPRKPPFVEVLGFSRPNLRIGVTDCSRAARKLARTVEIVNRLKNGIIYVATRKHAQTVYEELQRAVSASSGVEILMYHAALTEAQRTKVQRAFRVAEHPVVIATTAFGMGIDRADIRFVVHWDIPGGIEQYYQEIGRAGRDGARAECELLFSYADVKVQEFFVDGANPDAETGLKVWKMFAGCGNQVVEFDSATFARALGLKNGIAVATAANVLLNAGFLIRPEESRPYAYQVVEGVDEMQVQSVFNARREKLYRDRRRLRKMIDFAYFEGCRHKFILDYFGDQSPTRTCGGCDNCETIVKPLGPGAGETPPPPKDAASGGGAVSAAQNERAFAITSCDKRQAVSGRAAAGVLASSAVDMEDLLRRYLKIQDESRRLEAERKTLRDKIAASLSLSGETGRDMSVDECALHIRCEPKTVYKFDDQLLRNRLGRAYYGILEPDTRKMKACMDEVVRCLAPIIHKVGVPSGERLDAAIRAGRISSELVEGAVTRQGDFSFAVQRRDARLAG